MLATRSQVSVEFILLFSGVVLIFVLLFGIYFDKTAQVSDETIRFEAKDILHTMAFSSNAIFLEGPGANRSIYVPNTLSEGFAYDLAVYNNSLWINWSLGSLSYPLLFDGLSYTYSSSGNYIVRNIGGDVSIS